MYVVVPLVTGVFVVADVAAPVAYMIFKQPLISLVAVLFVAVVFSICNYYVVCCCTILRLADLNSKVLRGFFVVAADSVLVLKLSLFASDLVAPGIVIVGVNLACTLALVVFAVGLICIVVSLDHLCFYLVVLSVTYVSYVVDLFLSLNLLYLMHIK